jgi:hypothetical protein
MQAIVILFVLPLIVGVASQLTFRDAKRASLAAVVGTLVAIALCVDVLDSSGRWSWLAGLMVSPLPIAVAVAAVLVCHGRLEGHRPRRNGSP